MFGGSARGSRASGYVLAALSRGLLPGLRLGLDWLGGALYALLRGSGTTGPRVVATRPVVADALLPKPVCKLSNARPVPLPKPTCLEGGGGTEPVSG